MPKIDNKFTAYFIDTTTAPWTPLTGLSPTINIRETNGSLVVNEQAMVELGGWHYIYTFVWYNAYTDYLYDINPNDDRAFIQSWVTTDWSLNKWLAEINGWFAGFYVNYDAINSHTTRKVNEVKESIKEIKLEPQNLEPLFKRVSDDISLAKDDIIDTIWEIEFDEKEAKKLAQELKKVDKKLTDYIEDIKDDKTKIKEIADEFLKLELEDEKMEKEKELAEKKKEQEITQQIEEEFEKLEQEEKEEEKKELEKELAEKLKEAEEIKKELNSL